MFDLWLMEDNIVANKYIDCETVNGALKMDWFTS